MSVTLTTPFRAVPTLPLAAWEQEFAARQSPLTRAEIGDCYAACAGWSLVLDQAIGETSLRDADAIRDKNLLRLTEADGSTFKKYSAFWKPFAEAVKRLYDPAYKDGAYYPAAAAGISVNAGQSDIEGYNLSLAGYKVIYIGGPECLSSRGARCANGETYNPNRPMSGASVITDATAPSINRSIAAAMERYGRWFGGTPAPGPGPGPSPSPGLTFGLVPRPTWRDRQIPDANNIAWDALGQRRLRGIVYHRQQGTNWGTDGWFRTLWQPNGDPAGGQLGLTDFGIDHTTGETLQWNDYLGRGRSGISPNRSGWASGPWQNPPGDGRAFVQKYGVNAINRDLVSLEIAGWYDTAIAEAGMIGIVNLSAFLADQAEVPWTDYPLNPHTGFVFTFEHGEFQSEKPCAGAAVRARIPEIIERTQQRLKVYQTGQAA